MPLRVKLWAVVVEPAATASLPALTAVMAAVTSGALVSTVRVGKLPAVPVLPRRSVQLPTAKVSSPCVPAGTLMKYDSRLLGPPVPPKVGMGLRVTPDKLGVMTGAVSGISEKVRSKVVCPLPPILITLVLADIVRLGATVSTSISGAAPVKPVLPAASPQLPIKKPTLPPAWLAGGV